jgi:DME family drug/metabolite transporter
VQQALKESNSHTPALRVLSSAVLFGTVGTAITYAPDNAGGSALGIGRLAIGAILLLIFMPVFGGRRRNFFIHIRKVTVFFMAIGAAAFQPFFFSATTSNGVALSTLLTVGCIPIMSGAISAIVFREKFSKLWFAATGLAIIGLALRFWGEIKVESTFGAFMAIGAGFSVAVYVNAAKKALAHHENPIELTSTAYLLGSLFLIPLLLSEDLSWVLSTRGILVAFYLGAVTMALANIFQIYGLRKMSPSAAGTLALAEPLTATVLGVTLLDESLTTLSLIGIALVSAALIWLSIGTKSEQ